ncbi:MAG: transketolase family protein [Bdellovibrionales bacterium]|nr:transketolase family protein [Bdellovibrionales bacterium]
MANPAKATRQSFGEALARLGAENKNIVVLDADLSKSTKSDLFAKKFPERFFEMGIQEANMIGAASGLAFTGKLPFLCSFGAFITGRYDTIRLSAVYSAANIRLIGTHAGLGIGDDGHSQMGLEDIALTRVLPTMGVFQPMDDAETHAIMDYLVRDYTGPAYLRLTRQNLPDYSSTAQPFVPGKLREVGRFGNGACDVLALGTGAGVAEAVGAAEILAKSGRSTHVWNVHTLKPFDSKTLLELVATLKPKKIITVEDHSVIGGLGSCVAEVLADHGCGVSLRRYGCQDQFGESGDPRELFEKHGMSAEKIAHSLL